MGRRRPAPAAPGSSRSVCPAASSTPEADQLDCYPVRPDAAEVSSRAVVPEVLRGRPFTTSQARAAGVTPDQLRGPAYLSPFRRVHHEAGLERTPELRARACALLLPPGAAVGGAWAVHLLGRDVLPLDAGVDGRVEVVVPRGRRALKAQGLRCRVGEPGPRDVVVLRGVPLTSPWRTACDVARLHDDDVEAVVLLDALLQLHPQLRPEHWLEELRRWERARGARRARVRVDLARRGAESPMETRLRLPLVRAGLPEPVLQHEVLLGRVRYRLDLAWPWLRVAAEFDGGVHDDPRVNARDVARVTALEAAGWTVLRFRAVDVYRHADRVVAQVRAALARAEAVQTLR